jgi:hypothetical protein
MTLHLIGIWKLLAIFKRNMGNSYKKLYEALLKNGEIHLLPKSFKGTWEEDKDRFITFQQTMEKEVLNLEVEYEEPED